MPPKSTYSCPECGREFSRNRCYRCQADRRIERRADTMPRQPGESIADMLRRRYLIEHTSLHSLQIESGIPFRSFRRLFELYEIETRTASERVALQWVDADERRAQVAVLARTTIGTYWKGRGRPTDDPAVRAKISAAKRRDNPMHRPEIRAKVSATRKAMHERDPTTHINYIMAKTHRRSRIERIMQNALRAVSIHALHGWHIGRLWPDLVLPNARLVIECDGEQWHTPEADALRDAELNAAGWSVLHFTATEIGDDAGACAKRVVDWLSDRGLDASLQGVPLQSRLF